MDTKRTELLVEVVSAECLEYVGRTYDLADPSDLGELLSLSITRLPNSWHSFPSTVAIEHINLVFCYWELVPLLKATMKAIIRECLLGKKDIGDEDRVKTAMKLCEEFPAMAAMAKLKGEV